MRSSDVALEGNPRQICFFPLSYLDVLGNLEQDLVTSDTEPVVNLVPLLCNPSRHNTSPGLIQLNWEHVVPTLIC